MKGGKRFSHGGRCDQGIFRHQLLGNLPRKVLIDTTLDVDFSKLIKLKLSILTQLLAFPPEIRPGFDVPSLSTLNRCALAEVNPPLSPQGRPRPVP